MNKNICLQCGEIYEVCPKCKANGIFKWRLNYCGINCFKNSMKGVVKIMTVQYDSKVYLVKEHDLKEGKFILKTLDGDMIIMEDDERLQAVILPTEEYKRVKYGRFSKPKVEKKVEDDE